MKYGLNIAKKTGKQHPPALHYAYVEFGSCYKEEAMKKAQQFVDLLGHDDYVFSFNTREVCGTREEIPPPQVEILIKE